LTAIQTVEQSTQVAIDFVRKHYSFVYPIAARKENSRWMVDLDISYFRPSYVRVKLVAETGALEGFTVTLGSLLQYDRTDSNRRLGYPFIENSITTEIRSFEAVKRLARSAWYAGTNFGD
jgi:hypothetical protein